MTASSASELGDIAGLEDPRQVERIGRLVAGGTVEPGRRYLTTVTAHERDDAVVDVSDADGPRAQFTASGPGDGSYPAADARLVIRDRSLQVPERLPRHGVVRVDNAGSRAGDAPALRIDPKLTTEQAIRRAVERNQPMTAGTPTDLVGLVSAGTTNRAHVHLRPGRYLVLSRVGAHAYAVTKVGAHAGPGRRCGGLPALPGGNVTRTVVASAGVGSLGPTELGGRRVAATMAQSRAQRKPMWLMPVSIICGRRAAGR